MASAISYSSLLQTTKEIMAVQVGRQFMSKATQHLYWKMHRAMISRQLSPLRASSLIENAILNGHQPPEILSSSRDYLRTLISNLGRRGMHVAAMQEISRCLARGHVDNLTLLLPIADDYLRLIMSIRPTNGKTMFASEESAPAEPLVHAARFVAKLDHEGHIGSITPATLNQLIEMMNDESRKGQCSPAGIISIALKNNIPLTTQSWNIHLQILANRKNRSATALKAFDQMTIRNKVRPDSRSIAIVLKCLKDSPDQSETIRRLVELSKHLGLYNPVIALEELSMLKNQDRYPELLTRASEIFGAEIVEAFGFYLPKPASTTSILHEPTTFDITPNALNLIIDAMIRLNPSTADIQHLFHAYQRIIADKPSLGRNVYTQTLFVKAFAGNIETMEKALELLEQMRDTSGRQGQQKPTVVTYTNIIEGLCRHGAVDMASRVFEYMNTDGIVPTEHTWVTLIRGHLLRGDTTRAASYLKLMKRSRCPRGPHTQVLAAQLVAATRKEALHDS